MAKPTLCVDFDGVLHAYTSPWTNAETIADGPVPGALRWLWDACQHFDVQIYSSRSKSEAARVAMLHWLINNSRKEFPVGHPMNEALPPTYDYPVAFAAEKPAAFLTIDDRAICFRGNWAEIDPPALLKFKPWNKA